MARPPKRVVPPAKTRRALAKLRRAVKAAETAGGGGEGGEGLTRWESEFAASLEERLETYGSAFTDPAKGGAEEALSARQAQKLREIAKKARGGGGGGTSSKRQGGLKRGGGFKPKRPTFKARARDVDEDAPPSPPERPRFTVIDGGGGGGGGDGQGGNGQGGGDDA